MAGAPRPLITFAEDTVSSDGYTTARSGAVMQEELPPGFHQIHRSEDHRIAVRCGIVFQRCGGGRRIIRRGKSSN